MKLRSPERNNIGATGRNEVGSEQLGQLQTAFLEQRKAREFPKKAARVTGNLPKRSRNEVPSREEEKT